MDSILVNDDCDSCRYVINAFSFGQLPLVVCKESDVNSVISDKTAAVLVCHAELLRAPFIKKCFKKTNFSLIFSNNEKDEKMELETDGPPLHFLKKGFTQYDLNKILNLCSLYKENNDEDSALASPIYDRLIGKSPLISKIRTLIKQVACSDSTVMILGQSGTGKDLIASCIHQLSERKDKTFVPINCGAIPSELIESELFGHEKGAFTGALTRRAGRFELANHGTLFLDEIGDMPLQMQVKLLRVIQERVVERVGGAASVPVDVRIIAATHKNLVDMINQHQFREDLYYRINVFPIYVPSLSERQEDIPLLIEHQINQVKNRIKHVIGFTENAIEMLCQYNWPGNIRELQNFIERMMILYPDQIINENQINLNFKQNKIFHLSSHKLPEHLDADFPAEPNLSNAFANV